LITAGTQPALPARPGPAATLRRIHAAAFFMLIQSSANGIADA
jgi:hypothetical protein